MSFLSAKFRVFAVSVLPLVVWVEMSVAQVPLPDPTLWSDTINPNNGQLVVPAVIYDPSDGLMWLDTSGLNQVVETTTYRELGGDDVGFVTISIEGPPADSSFFNGLVFNPNIGGGGLWDPTYFNGKQQLFCIDGDPVEPGHTVEIFQYPSGLAPEDFGAVEVAVEFGTGFGTDVTFGSVQFVPEPTSLILSLGSLLILFGMRRQVAW